MKKKIIWAVDPFAKNSTLQRHAALQIQNLLLQSGNRATIEPIYFLNAPLFEGVRELPREWLERAKAEGQYWLDEILSDIQLAGVRPLRVIPISHSYLRAGVERLSKLAKKWKADLVVSSTHGGKGIRPLVLGSFAETLLLYSDVPLLLVNPRLKGNTQIKNILFPTDFSDESKKAFLEVLKLAKSTRGKITLFHRITPGWPPFLPLDKKSRSLDRTRIKAETNDAKKKANEWKNLAREKGVTAEVVIDFKAKRSLAEAILAQSNRRPGLIAMAAQSGAFRTALLGSTVRSVVRNTTFPVWILHPRKENSTKAKQPLYNLTVEDIETDLQRLPHV